MCGALDPTGAICGPHDEGVGTRVCVGPLLPQPGVTKKKLHFMKISLLDGPFFLSTISRISQKVKICQKEMQISPRGHRGHSFSMEVGISEKGKICQKTRSVKFLSDFSERVAIGGCILDFLDNDQ